MAVAKAPGSCELNKLLNRDWAVQVKGVGELPAKWIFVRGLDSVSVNIETSAVDSSDIDSQGWESQEKTSRKLTITLSGKHSVKGEEKQLEPSQKLIRDTGIELGKAGKIDVRVWRTDGTDEGWECTATNMYSTEAGDANGLRQWTANLQSACAPKRIKPVDETKVTAASEDPES
ncbi:phage tail tube protein [Corynebacterium argentoratense]|uniref:phage tail tube protein n=1 Tax=Corynebacterium argentoratense TaxID=42817 RepID=UPI001F27A0DD|nr:hypothetical protein [Corynebacterium argentoratense]MCF1694315.1 hypothetical protein [Corynebacterium argentoratense]MCF1735886.1 hypothetical protein [Corynebacterium argentoratense]DAS39056.1 MAG TPA: tail tube protein [Caudoviricetes sp.]